MKYLMWFATVSLGLMGLVRTGIAEDYTYLFDPSTMQVGQTVGEYLVVKDKCPTEQPCMDTEKLKYVTAEAGRTGRLEIPVSAGSDFEISFNIATFIEYICSPTLTIVLYLSDGSSLPLELNGSPYLGQCSTWVYYSNDQFKQLNWKAGVNDFRLISEQGNLKISANEILLEDVKLSLAGTMTSIVISKIDEDADSLFEIRTRGIQKGGSQSGGDFETGKQAGILQCQTDPASCSITVTPNVDPNLCKQTVIEQCQKDPASCGITTTNGTTGGTHATFNPCTRELYIPLVDVPGEFGVMQTYEVYLVQQPSTLTFGLDMNRLKVVP